MIWCRVVLAVVLGSLCGAAPAGPSLTQTMPDYLAEALTARVLAAAGGSGLGDAMSLGKPYVLQRGGRILGVLVSGRGTEAGPGDRQTCFVALVRPGAATAAGPVALVSTVGRGQWAGQGCSGIGAMGLLPSGPGRVRLGILYDSDAGPNVPVVLDWRDAGSPALDDGMTAACVARHVTGIAEMRRPGCGARTPLERAFPTP